MKTYHVYPTSLEPEPEDTGPVEVVMLADALAEIDRLVEKAYLEGRRDSGQDCFSWSQSNAKKALEAKP